MPEKKQQTDEEFINQEFGESEPQESEPAVGEARSASNRRQSDPAGVFSEGRSFSEGVINALGPLAPTVMGALDKIEAWNERREMKNLLETAPFSKDLPPEEHERILDALGPQVMRDIKARNAAATEEHPLLSIAGTATGIAAPLGGLLKGGGLISKAISGAQAPVTSAVARLGGKAASDASKLSKVARILGFEAGAGVESGIERGLAEGASIEDMAKAGGSEALQNIGISQAGRSVGNILRRATAPSRTRLATGIDPRQVEARDLPAGTKEAQASVRAEQFDGTPETLDQLRERAARTGEPITTGQIGSSTATDAGETGNQIDRIAEKLKVDSVDEMHKAVSKANKRLINPREMSDEINDVMMSKDIRDNVKDGFFSELDGIFQDSKLGVRLSKNDEGFVELVDRSGTTLTPPRGGRTGKLPDKDLPGEEGFSLHDLDSFLRASNKDIDFGEANKELSNRVNGHLKDFRSVVRSQFEIAEDLAYKGVKTPWSDANEAQTLLRAGAVDPNTGTRVKVAQAGIRPGSAKKGGGELLPADRSSRVKEALVHGPTTQDLQNVDAARDVISRHVKDMPKLRSTLKEAQKSAATIAASEGLAETGMIRKFLRAGTFAAAGIFKLGAASATADALSMMIRNKDAMKVLHKYADVPKGFWDKVLDDVPPIAKLTLINGVRQQPKFKQWAGENLDKETVSAIYPLKNKLDSMSDKFQSGGK